MDSRRAVPGHRGPHSPSGDGAGVLIAGAGM